MTKRLGSGVQREVKRWSVNRLRMLGLGVCCLGGGVCLSADEIGQVWIAREIVAQQAMPGEMAFFAPIYQASASVRFVETGLFGTGYLEFPGGFFVQSDSLASMWRYAEQFGSEARMRSSFPAGTYHISLDRGNSNFREIAFAADTAPFPASFPLVTNYPALQHLDPAQPFAVTWEPWNDAPPDAFLNIEIWEDRPGAESVLTYRGGLEGDAVASASAFTVPAGVLPRADATYALRLGFGRRATRQVGGIEGSPEAELVAADLTTTLVELGRSTDAALQPTATWSLSHDFAWPTAGRTYLEPAPQFPPSSTATFVFAPDEGVFVPPTHVRLEGPIGSPFATGSGQFFDFGEGESGIRYFIPAATIGWPENGDYTVTYRDRSYVFALGSTPRELERQLPFPRVELDATGQIAAVAWDYRSSGTGAPTSRPDGLMAIDLAVDGPPGVERILHFDLAPETNRITPTVKMPWEQVLNVSLRLRFTDGTVEEARFQTQRFDRPAQIYFEGGVASDDGWVKVPWFDWVHDATWPWCWTPQHGWLYARGHGGLQQLLYDRSLGWWWTHPNVFPTLYSYREGAWLYHAKDTVAPLRWFYRYGSTPETSGWIREDALNSTED